MPLRLLSLLFASVLLSAVLDEPSLAQSNAKPGPNASKPAPKAAPAPTAGNAIPLLQLPPGGLRRIGCTAQQITKIAAVRQRLLETTERLIEEEGKSQDGVGRAFLKSQEARTKAETAALKLLSAPQLQAFKQVQAQFPRHEALGASAYRLTAVAGLTPDQQAQLKGLAESTTRRRTEIVSAAKTDAERKEIVGRLRELDRQTEEAIRKVLTPPQRQRFEEALQTASPSAPAKGPGTKP